MAISPVPPNPDGWAYRMPPAWMLHLLPYFLLGTLPFLAFALVQILRERRRAAAGADAGTSSSD